MSQRTFSKIMMASRQEVIVRSYVAVHDFPNEPQMRFNHPEHQVKPF